ncbi:hypothetical protein [Streptomyces sp. ODS28]|uniref:hypothetical protein n=1 Tax=Streptomyces sp. ODS28 TaxID=3136688 RepID=UPI0031F07654
MPQKRPEPGSHQQWAQHHAQQGGNDHRNSGISARYEMRKSNVEGKKAMKENKEKNAKAKKKR